MAVTTDDGQSFSATAIGDEDLDMIVSYDWESLDNESGEYENIADEFPISKAMARNRKNKPRRRKRPMLVRLFKTDIRRYYSSMVANVFNSQDLNLLQSFFATYCTPRMHLRPISNEYERETGVVSIHRHKDSLVSNVTGLLMFSAFIMQITPDTSMNIDDVKIHTRSDTSEARIVISISMPTTHIYDVDVNDVAEEMVKTAHSINHVHLSHSACETGLDGNEIGDARLNSVVRSEATRASLGDLVSVAATLPIENTGSSGPREQDDLTTADQNIARISSPAKLGTAVQVPNALAYYEATRGHSLPLRSRPEQEVSRIKLVMYVNRQRQIDHVAVFPWDRDFKSFNCCDKGREN